MDTYSIFLLEFGLSKKSFTRCFWLNFWQNYLPFVSRRVKAREPDLEWKILRFWFSSFLFVLVGGERRVYKLLKRLQMSVREQQRHIQHFSSYRDIDQKRNFHSKSLKNYISQRRIWLLDSLWAWFSCDGKFVNRIFKEKWVQRNRVAPNTFFHQGLPLEYHLVGVQPIWEWNDLHKLSC